MLIAREGRDPFSSVPRSVSVAMSRPGRATGTKILRILVFEVFQEMIAKDGNLGDWPK